MDEVEGIQGGINQMPENFINHAEKKTSLV